MAIWQGEGLTGRAGGGLGVRLLTPLQRVAQEAWARHVGAAEALWAQSAVQEGALAAQTAFRAECHEARSVQISSRFGI